MIDKPIVRCPGCGSSFPESEGILNRYGVASPECWQAFNELLAFERTLWGYPDIHRLVVDAYSVQHPQNEKFQKKLGISKRFVDASIQSIALHLIALYFALVERKNLNEISSLMDRILSKGAIFSPLTPPAHLGKITIADAPKKDSIELYEKFAWQWAKEAWMAWSDHHDQVKMWIDIHLNKK